MNASANADPQPADTANGNGSTVAASRTPLDHVMIAMDVVDTLRHDQLIVERELNGDERKAKLIERLREIYSAQGIDVPDKILEEGVRALEEDRFVYNPPADTLKTRLLKLYVTRSSWGQYAIGALGAVAALWIGWFALYEWPRQSALSAQRTELQQTIPTRLTILQKQIEAETALSGQSNLTSGVASTVRRGLAAARAGNLTEARATRADLEDQLTRLSAAYTIRIVSRKGELSGLWRIPKVNRATRNYYLVVEAVDARGNILKQTILNEETSKRETVTKWAVRVPRDVLERVRADKADDGILNVARVGVKKRGYLEPEWQVQVNGGAITRW
ncbi:MAG: hypothetical protein ACI89J_004223 [Hyphomicrobiaceae bacterium]